MWKKTFKTIQQLSCFVGHPVLYFHAFSHNKFSSYKISTITIFSFLSLKSNETNKNFTDFSGSNGGFQNILTN